jgi:hypothetical protein
MTRPPTTPMGKPPTTAPGRIQELFAAVVELPAAERDAYLDSACGGDRALRRELLELAAAADAAPAFLDRNAADVELAGHLAGPWRIDELLSSGGMGDVHVATRADVELPWRVALKVLKRGLDGDAFVRRFHAERRTLAGLAHPNIVALIDAGTLDDGRPFLATELIEGEPIDRHCAQRQLPLEARIRLLLSVCGAVAHAHQRLVVHCDLKPANVLVTAEGVPKLLDFGIARLIAQGTSPSAAPTAGADIAPRPWTAGYASPEQMDGCDIGCASDVWSLGVLIHETCTGERAFAIAGRSRAEIESAVRAGTPAPTTTPTTHVGRRLRSELDAIVRKALSRRPADRYGSVEQLAADLRACLEGRPVIARGGGALYRWRRLVQRNRVATAACVVAIASLAVGVDASWQSMLRAREEARLGWGAHAQALRVSHFLEQLVLDASAKEPGVLGPALDRAVARLAAAPPLAAEAEGRMRIALGALYLELGRPADARPQLERALALASSHRGFGRDDVERVQELLAKAAER